MAVRVFPFTDALCELVQARVLTQEIEDRYRYAVGWPGTKMPRAGMVTRWCGSREDLEQLCRRIAAAGLEVLGHLPPVEVERRRYLVTENVEPNALDGFWFTETEKDVVGVLHKRWSGTRDQYLQVFDLDTGKYWEWRTDTGDPPDALPTSSS